jgi:peptide/nickel transport system ATP-binding protein
MTQWSERHVPESDRSQSASLLDVRGLTVRYATQGGAITAVDDVSFTVGRGERVALVGESGSGKTGTCLAIAGFLTQSNATVTAERIAFDGMDVTARKSGRIPTRLAGLALTRSGQSEVSYATSSARPKG